VGVVLRGGKDEVGEDIGEHRRLGCELIVWRLAIEAPEQVCDRGLSGLHRSAHKTFFPGATLARAARAAGAISATPTDFRETW
jgi:hypothetical protein